MNQEEIEKYVREISNEYEEERGYLQGLIKGTMSIRTWEFILHLVGKLLSVKP